MNFPIRRAAHRARIGYLAESFDRFHFGHLALLRQARFDCDLLVVGVLADEQLVAAGEPAEWPLAQRLEAVRRSRFVDEVVPHRDEKLMMLWNRTGFDVIFMTGDRSQHSLDALLEEEVRSLGAEVVNLPFPRALSPAHILPPTGG
jgi:glycerol-3-phosphate cytidylyltransferase